ncbi:unnamed protein product, partial [Sphacelaria rigidula]
QVQGVVCLESAAYGKYLCVEPDGKVVADRSWGNSWEQFRLERFVSDPHQQQQQQHQRTEGDVPSHAGAIGCDLDASIAAMRFRCSTEHTSTGATVLDLECFVNCLTPRCRDSCYRNGTPGASGGVGGAGTGGLFIQGGDKFALRTFHGQYLGLDERGTVFASARPVLWTTDESNGICHCEGTVPWAAPPRASRRQV